MFWFRKLILLLPWERRKREEALGEELNSHIEMVAEEARNSGLSAEDALFAARRDLGSRLKATEQVRGEWLSPKIDIIAQDVRYAWRTLARTPSFTVVAVLSLALGIGAATAVFSVVHGVILKPIAYREPGRLTYVQEVVPALARVYGKVPVNIQHFLYWRDHTRTFQSMAALRASGPTLTGSGEPVQLDGVETTADLFRVLDVNMERGRGFLPGEDQPGKNNVAVITDSLWKRKFHGDREIVGRTIVLEGKPAAIVGVLPANFTFPTSSDLGSLAGLGKKTDVFQPLQEVIDGWDGDYDYICIGRLKPGLDLTQGLAELQVLTSQMNAAHQIESQPHPECRPLQEVITGSVRTSLMVLFAAVMALLLIVCVNLTNLLLARASARSREFSIRTAIGAGRGRLVQQILTEIAMLSLMGGALGTAISVAAIRAFAASASVHIPRLDEVQVDPAVLLFSFFTTAACACLCGLIPAIRTVSADPQEALRAGSHTVTAHKQSLRTRESLVGIEVALSTVLLFLAGLLISSLFHLMSVDKGFQAERAIAVDLGLPDAHYREVADRNKFFDRALLEVRALPGVQSAGMVAGLPLTGETHVNGIEPQGGSGSWIGPATKGTVLINVRFISPGYLETLAIPVLKGRAIEPEDRNRRVAMVSERLAAKVWPGENPIGKRFKTGSQVGQVEVVGVVRDTYNGRLEDGPTSIAYAPYWLRGPNYGSLVVRTKSDPTQFMQAIQHTVWSIDPSLAVPPLRTMSEVVDNALAQRRFQMRLATAFGVAALLLALIGIYGVVAYSVAQRRMELGLRLTLGATRNGLLAMVLRRGLWPVFLGLGAGLLLCLAISRFVRTLLFGVAPIDPFTIGAVSVILSATAVLACLLPARAAATMDPAGVLRYE
jgi:predicted permease